MNTIHPTIQALARQIYTFAEAKFQKRVNLSNFETCFFTIAIIFHMYYVCEEVKVYMKCTGDCFPGGEMARE
jgi:hypothetical protein